MTPDTHLERVEKATVAAGARQYVKKLVEGSIDDGLSGLEAVLGGTEISVERAFATLGGIMAMRRLLRSVERDIRQGQESVTPPSP